WDFLVRLPEEYRAGWIAAIERVEKIADPCGAPNVAPLHFRQAELAALDHSDELLNGSFSFCHREVTFLSNPRLLIRIAPGQPEDPPQSLRRLPPGRGGWRCLRGTRP